MAHVNSITLRTDAFQQSTSKKAILNTVDMMNAPVTNNSLFETFKDYTNLKSVSNITTSVSNMQGTFSGCSLLEVTPSIPSTVTDITNAFVNCSNLTTTPSIPSGVTAMSGAFAGCSQLTIPPTIPAAVSDISNAFKGTAMNGFAALSANITNTDYAFANSSIVSAPDMSSATSLIHMIGTFEGCSSLTSAPVIPSNVINMESAFEGCSSLASAPSVPSGVTSLKKTFKGCSLVSTAPSLPASLTDMSEAFAEVSSLSAFPAIPNSVTDMSGAFKNCDIPTSAPDLSNVSSLTNVADAFNGCTALTGDIHISSESVDNAVNCFGETSATKNVYIPFVYLSNGVNTATYNAFITAGYKEDGSVNGVYLKDDGSIIFRDWSYIDTTGNGDYELTGYIGNSVDVVIPTV